MKVLMLGWEYPPHISGGLGTACEGLTTALSRLKIDIDLVLPQLFGGERAPHLRLIDSRRGGVGERAVLLHDGDEEIVLPATESAPPVFSSYSHPQDQRFWAPESDPLWGALWDSQETPDTEAVIRLARQRAYQLLSGKNTGAYGDGLFREVERYAASVVSLFGVGNFDLIHAHDWMTYPAAMALKRITGKPLIAHVHSLEYDRSGQNGHPYIQHIEGNGISQADAVIAVSHYTRSIIRQEHPVPVEKIHVVHNGVYPRAVVESYRRERGTSGPTVLFLGRITFQKGPENFVEAAARVLSFVPTANFVMAGAGDLLPRMRQRVRELGIEKQFHFPGFVRGSEVEEMFSTADVYVMPSVSEPFGISALEAISFDTPVILSRQSGVSEVLNNALKVDFWDVERMAELITHALLHEELRRDMIEMARDEVRRLRWDAAAIRTLEVYRKLVPEGGRAHG